MVLVPGHHLCSEEGVRGAGGSVPTSTSKSDVVQAADAPAKVCFLCQPFARATVVYEHSCAFCSALNPCVLCLHAADTGGSGCSGGILFAAGSSPFSHSHPRQVSMQKSVCVCNKKY